MQLRTRSEGNDEGRTNMRAVSMIHDCNGNDLTFGQPMAYTTSADEGRVCVCMSKWREGLRGNLFKHTRND